MGFLDIFKNTETKNVSVAGTDSQGGNLTGWRNMLTGIGMSRDKRTGSQPYYMAMSPDECEELFCADPTARKIVSKRPEKLVSKWFSVEVNDPDLSKKIDDYLVSTLDFKNKLEKGLIYGNLYGGCGGLLIIKDGQELSMPVNENQISEIKSITLYRKDYVTWGERDKNIESKFYGEPLIWNISTENEGTVRVHRDRILRFDGVLLPSQKYKENNYWHGSVLDEVYNSIINYNTANNSTIALIQDIALWVFKIQGVNSMRTTEQKKIMKERMGLIDDRMSILGKMVIDKDDDVTRQAVPMTGIEHVLNNSKTTLIGDSDMPHTVLFGESPNSSLGGGDNSPGATVTQNWYESLEKFRINRMDNIVKRIVKLAMLCKSGPTGGKLLDFTIKYPPLKEETQTELLKNRETQSKIDKIYLDAQVNTPDEIAGSRFSGTEYNYETILNEKERKVWKEENPKDD